MESNLNRFAQIERMLVGTIFTVLLTIVYKVYGYGGQSASYCLMLCFLAAAVIWDIEKRTIPDALVVSGMLTAFVCSFINSGITILSALSGGFIAGGVFLFISLVTRNGVGLGDAKLLGCVGMFLGLEKVLAAMLFSVILSGITGIAFLLISPRNRKKTIPYAPFITLGAVISLIF